MRLCTRQADRSACPHGHGSVTTTANKEFGCINCRTITVGADKCDFRRGAIDDNCASGGSVRADEHQLTLHFSTSKNIQSAFAVQTNMNFIGRTSRNELGSRTRDGAGSNTEFLSAE